MGADTHRRRPPKDTPHPRPGRNRSADPRGGGTWASRRWAYGGPTSFSRETHPAGRVRGAHLRRPRPPPLYPLPASAAARCLPAVEYLRRTRPALPRMQARAQPPLARTEPRCDRRPQRGASHPAYQTHLHRVRLGVRGPKGSARLLEEVPRRTLPPATPGGVPREASTEGCATACLNSGERGTLERSGAIANYAR